MFNTAPRGAYGVIGVMLGLVSLYLILENGNSASGLINAVGSNGSSVLKTLQGR